MEGGDYDQVAVSRRSTTIRNAGNPLDWGDQPPPAFPITVGVWIQNADIRASYWRVFSAEYGTTSYFDEHIRSWQPLPRADA